MKQRVILESRTLRHDPKSEAQAFPSSEIEPCMRQTAIRRSMKYKLVYDSVDSGGGAKGGFQACSRNEDHSSERLGEASFH